MGNNAGIEVPSLSGTRRLPRIALRQYGKGRINT